MDDDIAGKNLVTPFRVRYSKTHNCNSEMLSMTFRTLFVLIFSFLATNFLIAQEPTSPQVPMKGYLFGPGDQIVVTVAGDKDYDFIASIDDDGDLEVPYPDNKSITAKCMTERELRMELTKRLEKWIRTPQVSIRTDKRSRPPATVYGMVNNPGRIEMMRKATLVEVLAFSGGVREDESSGIVQVIRTQPPLCSTPDDKDNWKSDAPNDPTIVPSRTFSLAKIKVGTDESNPTIYPGDVIYVHKAAPVYLTGEVFSPQGIYLKEGGLSLQRAIGMVGGFKNKPKTDAITIHRLRPGTADQYDNIIANYDLIRTGQQKDVILQPYDVVEVGQAKDSVAVSVLKYALGAGKGVVAGFSGALPYRVLY